MKRTRRIGSWLSRLRASWVPARPAPAPSAAPSPSAVLPTNGPLAGDDALEVIGNAGLAGRDPERAVDALRRLLGTTRERAALDAVLGAAAAGRVPENLRIMAAHVLVERGEPAPALGLLAGSGSSAALLLAADLRAERGELPQALSLVERLLARDLDAPGARERRDRWRARLGVPEAREAEARDATLLVPEAPETGLRVVGEVGRGGAGTVYEAVDDALGRRVALKVYHRPKEARSQLIREATLAVRVAGPGIVRVFDADPERGWLVMEWLPHGSLKQALVRGDMSLLMPIERWLVPLIETVAFMHARGLVHADLKPANVLFRAGGAPVVADLGLAQAPGGQAVGGSAGYMSPERLEQRPLSLGDDVYALGRILEDAVETLEREAARSGVPGLAAAWRELVALATGPERPETAYALLSRAVRAASEAVPGPAPAVT